MVDRGLCESFVITDSFHVADKSFAFGGNKAVYARDLSSADVASFLERNGDATVLYPLATPVTEERGYVENWPTDLPSGCQISIPELDDLNIRYHIDESVMEIARQWYERARSEYAEELMELRVTVNELATRIN
jgi:hypothetical protein